MRRSLILCLCIALCSAWTARAERISITNVYGDIAAGTLQYERSAVPEDAALDLLTIYFVSDQPGALDRNLSALEGTWTASTGGISLSPNYDAAIWQQTTGATTEQQDAYANNGGIFASYVNMANPNGNPEAGRPAVPTWALFAKTYYGTTTHGELYSTFSGAWGGVLDPSTDTVLANLYVTAGADVAFDGVGGQAGSASTNGWAFLSTPPVVNLAGGFSTAPIPEPSTLALAGMGLIGLLCYAWRKRR